MKRTEAPRGSSITAAMSVILFLAAAAPAHDFWIEPIPARAEPGQRIAAALRVGMSCPGEPVKRRPDRVERFALIGPEGTEMPAEGGEGADPAGAATPTTGGLHTIVYRGKPVPIELGAQEFEAYLREEGLDRVIAARRERNQSDAPGKEIYSRCAKALVAVGEVAESASDRAQGLRYELVAEGNPMRLAPARDGGAGVRLVVSALFEGKPLEGVQIKAMHCEGSGGQGVPSPPIRTVRTGASGSAAVTIDAPGRWVISSVEMRDAPPGSGADWESLWASLVFETASGAARSTGPATP